MSFKVDNAVIMAAGTASRFAPLSYEKPKALIEVRGEILIERQIKQLKEAEINEIIIVVGYKKEQFYYLKDKYNVKIVENDDYLTRNNNASIYAVKDYLKNTYICSSDNYFNINPFKSTEENAYYAAIYADGETAEWCMDEDEKGYISNVTIGGKNKWFMLGHTLWNEKFSNKFISILDKIYDLPETKNLLWESIFIEHLSDLKMKIRKYDTNDIFEFDTLDELRLFDPSYVDNTRSEILKIISKELSCSEKDLINIHSYKDSNNEAAGFRFKFENKIYEYCYKNKKMRRI